ncbi:MAG: hypothetical protein JSR77_06690 [Planctomycetes bacterium]|nr:hypothetical protein [Planctomycetota bacterium]
MSNRFRNLCVIAPIVIGAIAAAQPAQLKLVNVPDFSQKNLAVWRNYCAPTAGADVVYYLSNSYPALAQGNPWGPGAAADAGVNTIIGKPPAPLPGTISALMGTTTARGTTLQNCANGLDAYLEANDGMANVTWNTSAVLLSGYPLPAGQNFFTACQQTLASNGVVILAVHWTAAPPPGYDIPDGYIPYDDLNTPMGHALAMTGYDTTLLPQTLYVNDPGNNLGNMHNWANENLAIGIAGLPNAMNIVINGMAGRVYGAVLATPVVHQVGFNLGIGTLFGEGANAIAATFDGGFVTAGFTENPFLMGRDILVVKYDPDGNPQWASRLIGPGNDIAYSIKQTRDGGFIVGAETDSVGPLLNLVMVRLDPNGMYMWSWVYEGDTSAEDIVLDPTCGVAVSETLEGAFVMTGRKVFNPMGQMGMVVYAAPGGNPIWMFGYGDPRLPYPGMLAFTDVKAANDGTVYVVGTESYQSITGDRLITDPVLMRLAPNGQPIFLRDYNTVGSGAIDREWGTGDGLDICADGSIVMAGRTNRGLAGFDNLRVTRTDPFGNILWNRVYPDKASAYRSIRQDLQTTILVGGWSLRLDADAPISMMMVLDPNIGMPLWANGYGFLARANGSVPLSVMTAAGGYALTGTFNMSVPPPLDGHNIELIKTDLLGNTACRQQALHLNMMPDTLSDTYIQPYEYSGFSATFWQVPFTRTELLAVDLCCPPCPADYNEDGGVDGSDVGAFFADWEIARPCADVNRDGGVDGSDVGTFYIYWEAGGC